MGSITPTPSIWMNGELVAWDAATVHVGTHTLHYGSGVFEGIRAYPCDGKAAIFRLDDHVDRFFASMRILGMVCPFDKATIKAAILETVASTGLSACYIRPLAYYGYGAMGLDTTDCAVEVVIMAWPWDAIWTEEDIHRGLSLNVSSWVRHNHNTMPPLAKTVGNYVNSSLAKRDARKAGVDNAVLLNAQGLVSECLAENILIVRGGRISSPPASACTLEGITLESVIALADDRGLEIHRENISRSDLYLADEIFICGTAAEVTSIRSIDGRSLDCPGPVATELRQAYLDAVHGRIESRRDWIDLI